jgi:PAS domain S-box-containing protein
MQSKIKRGQVDQLTISILNSIAEPLLVLDEARLVMLLNPAAEGLFQMTSDDAAGKTLADVVRSEDLTALAERNKALPEWEAPDRRTFVPRIEPVRNNGGETIGWVLSLRDITQYKKLNRNQTEFTRIVSHDLRSPLTYMQGFASMLEMVGPLNEKQSGFVEKILAGITQMTGLVDNIQDAGRFDPETGFYEMQRAQCDVGEIVHKIVNNHLVPAEKQELTIEMKVADDVPIINADANMLERAITNLVDNAIKYTPNGGKIQVNVLKRDGKLVISVKDSGLGINAEQQKQLFQRHVRIARQEFKKIKGSGLGLFIVRSVAQRHNGDAWVDSVEGQGSTFSLSIPLEGPNLVIPGQTAPSS